jgi:acetyltransferase
MTYTIHRYPVHLIDVVRLADAGRVTIRPTLPQDIELQQDFFRSLTFNDRYSRFMAGFRELPHTLVERFANIDYHDHLALLAEVSENDQAVMIGEARYAIDQHDPTRCEFAIAVAASWRASGLARILLQRLERQAAQSGIRHIAADTLIDNRAMIRLAASAGYAVTTRHDDATLARLEKQLTPSAVPQPVQPLAA